MAGSVARSTTFLFLLVLLLSFSMLSHSPFHTHTPNPGHPSVYDSSSDYMEGKPWGKGASLSHRKLCPKSTRRIPVAFALPVLFLLGVEGRHGCRNAQPSKYTVAYISGPRARRTIPVSWKVVQSLRRGERLRKKSHIMVFDS